MTKAALPPITLVLGGARAGKSRFAEELIESTRCPALYLATAEPRDEEMRARIAAHRARRGTNWTTVEEPLDMAPPRRSKLVTKLVASLVVLVVCAGATAWFTWKTNTALSTSPLSNTALSDAAGSTEVIGQATQAVEQVFSYTYTDLPKTERAMNSWLTGRAVEQYQALYGQLKTQAAQQKLTLQTTVRTIGVVSLQGDRAELLAFLDQRAVREGTATPSTGGGQLKIVAVRAGGTWKVSDFGTL